MSDKASPFETLAADVVAQRQEIRDNERRLNAARQMVAQTWQRQINSALHKASQQMTSIQVSFGQVELKLDNNVLTGLQYPVYGLAMKTGIVIQVNSPSVAEVSLKVGGPKKTFDISNNFVEDEFLNAVSEALRPALLQPVT